MTNTLVRCAACDVRSAMRRRAAFRSAFTLAAALTIACSGAGASADVEKAQIAVRANPSLELVATDERQGVLTVKVRKSGRVITVSVADVISGVAFRDLDAEAPAHANANAAPRSGSGGNAAASASSRVAVSTPEGRVSVDRSRNGVAVSTPEGQVAVRQSGSGVAVSTPDTRVGVRQTPSGSLAVSTPDTKVKVGADGISVQDRTAAAEAGSARPAPASGGSAQDPSGMGANIDDARLDRQSRQISCTADGTVDVVNVLLRVDDVAIKTVGGCRIHIRNSHVIGDMGVQAIGGSTVTIENSIIEGRTALSLQGSVNMSVQSSTIRGPVRRVGSVTLRDLGNNLWR